MPGNHEYQNGYFRKPCYIGCDDNRAFILDTDVVSLLGITFIGATLWSDLCTSEELTRLASSKVSLYKTCRFHDLSKDKCTYIDSVDTTAKHHEDVAFIKAALKADEKPKVVITHHAPTVESLDFSIPYNGLESAYASDTLKKFQSDGVPMPRHWFHGHIHRAFNYYSTYGVQVSCNPLGHNKVPSFDPDFHVEIPAG